MRSRTPGDGPGTPLSFSKIGSVQVHPNLDALEFPLQIRGRGVAR